MKKTLLSLGACVLMAASADAMYIVGDPVEGGWNPANGIEMTEADGGYKWTGTVDAGKWFAFATELVPSGDWTLFNSTYRLNPPANGTFAAEGQYTLELGGSDRAFQGNGSDVTFFIKEEAGVYTLTVTEKEVEGDPLYMVGQVPGCEWNPTQGLKMKSVNGGWKWTGLLKDNEYFAFATQLTDSVDWDTFNNFYRLSPVVADMEGDRNVQANAGVYALRVGMPEGAFFGNGMESEYFVQKSDSTYTLTVTEIANPVDPGFPEDATWSVVGTFNGWGETPDFPMTQIRPGVWKATMYDFSGEFKFRANNEWEYNFGAAEDYLALIEGDGDYAAAQGGFNFNIPDEVEEVIFELDVNNNVLNVSGLTPKMLALRGSMNDWNFEWSYLFMDYDGIFSLYLDGVDPDWEFKISDQDWFEEYTTGVTDMVAGEEYPLLPGAGKGNMGIAKAYSEVTMMFSLDDMYFMFFGQEVEDPDSVAITGADAAKTRYFNLQGVEVTKPENGIFVRVRNGKSEKITVK